MKNAWDTWREIRWRGGIVCVFCSSASYRRHSVRRGGMYRYRCLNCRRIFSDVSGTFLQFSKISLEKWRIAEREYLQNRQISLCALQKILGVSYPTVFKMMNSLRRALRDRQVKISEGKVLLGSILL